MSNIYYFDDRLYRVRYDRDTRKLYEEWWDFGTGTWKVVEQWSADTQTSDIDHSIRKSVPAVRLTGTEIGAKDLAIRENAGAVELYDYGAGAIAIDWSLNPKLAYSELKTDTIQVPIYLPLLTNEQTGLAADSGGVKYTTPYHWLADTNVKKHLKALYIEAHIEASHADSRTDIELYSESAAVVRGFVRANAGARVRSADFVAALVEGEEHSVRVNVTTASTTAGATTGCRMARLVMLYGIS